MDKIFGMAWQVHGVVIISSLVHGEWLLVENEINLHKLSIYSRVFEFFTIRYAGKPF